MKLCLRRSMIPVFIALMGFLLVGCASAPKTGVRPAFQSHILQRVAVVPFYAQSNFSLSPEALARVLAQSEQAAVASLRDYGFVVIEPADFKLHLQERDAATRFDEGIVLNTELSSYFEPAKTPNGPSLEVATLAELNRDGAIRVDALLLGEVVYHTETTCNHPTSPSREAPKGVAESSQTTPCVVSHFQAKLVYVATGETMWFNRALLETYPPSATPDSGVENMTQAVARTFAGPDGLDAFEPAEPASAPDQRIASE